MHKGLDSFTVDPGSKDTMHCVGCHSECEVTRDVYGPTGYASAMAKKYALHDAFTCPHTEEGWHELAVRLVMAIEDMPSRRVADLMRLDLQDLLAEHGKS